MTGTLSRLLLWSACVLILATIAHGQVSKKELTTMKNGLDGGKGILNTVSKLGDETSKIFKTFGKMSAFLGGAAGLVSLALVFLPTSESAELLYMKAKFAEVNSKLDILTSKLDDIQDLITYENQRSTYTAAAAKILHGHKQLQAMIDELAVAGCGDVQDCKVVRTKIAERYVKDFDIDAEFFHIMHGCIKSTSVFGEPLLDLFKKTKKCDVSELETFASGVTRLAFKAQQVILAHEKLTGSEHSITESMNAWLTAVYDLRSYMYLKRKECYDETRTLMETEINDKKYQLEIASNVQANHEVKTAMEQKYTWLGLNVHSYGAYGGGKHCVINSRGAFYSMPPKDERKRNLIVSFYDKDGTFAEQKYKVLNALDGIAKDVDFGDKLTDACKMNTQLVEELRKDDVWKYIMSLSVLRDYSDFEIDADNADTYINKEYTFNAKALLFFQKLRLVIVLKSLERAEGSSCSLSCSRKGSCQTAPYSSPQFCECNPYYQGDNCEEHAKAELAATMDALVKTMFTLPTMADVYYDIQNMRDLIGTGLGDVQDAIRALEETFKAAFDQLGTQLTAEFQWSNLITQYSQSIQQIKYYSERFQNVKTEYPTTYEDESIKLADAVLAADGVRKWLHDLEFLFTGRTGDTLLDHQPLMVLYMDKHVKDACSTAYKNAVATTWRQLVLLQQSGYTLWAQSLDLKDQPTNQVQVVYAQETTSQQQAYNAQTCQYSVPHSTNLQCTGFNYIHPGMNIENKCPMNYYVKGNTKTTCTKKGTECKSCSCSSYGSAGKECSDQSGQCICNALYYGTQCQHRDCRWGSWGSWGRCSKTCGYGGFQTKSRQQTVTQKGFGKFCTGAGYSLKTCFSSCCRGEYHCATSKQCIAAAAYCDYVTDCTKGEDQTSACAEKCVDKYTSWNTIGNGKSHYLDKHYPSCGGDGYVLNRFRLEVELKFPNFRMRYKIKCCKLNKYFAKESCLAKTSKTTPFNYDGGGNMYYLDRHELSCGTSSFINNFGLKRDSSGKNIRYQYRCCDLVSKFQKKTKCYGGATVYQSHGGGKNYMLNKHDVYCNAGYFFSSFKLQRNGDNVRYIYKCCKINM